MSYLKKVTRRVDCWLGNEKTGRSSMTPRNASIEKEEHEFSYFEHSLERNKTFMEEPKSKIGMGAKYAVRVKPRLQTEEENTLSTISLNNTRSLKKKKKERTRKKKKEI